MTSHEHTRTHDPTPSLWTRLRDRRHTSHPASASFASSDPGRLERRLEQSDCFCRDSAIGKLYHRKEVSFREISTTDSLHVTIDEEGQVKTHVDRRSPLARRQPGGRCRYSPLRIAAHNVSGMAGDVVRLVLGPRASGLDDDATSARLGGTDDEAMQIVAPHQHSAVEARCRPAPSLAGMERTYSVPGISCDHCKRSIEAELGPMDGVERVEVDVATRTVVVVGSISDDDVRSAIDEAGYEVEATGS